MAPQVTVEQVAVHPGEPGSWRVTWCIQNAGNESVQLLACHVPHGRFRGPRVDLSSADKIAPGVIRELPLSVSFDEPPGVTVENAFLILTAVLQQTKWRILIRMTVESDSVGAPVARTELITTQKVGFSDTRQPHIKERSTGDGE